MIFILSIILLLLIFGIFEKHRHSFRLRRIPIRIHINGTRGKSLLTRMVVDLFHNDGRSVAAKITGEQPQFFSSKAGWKPWHRRAPPRIKEQMQFIKKIISERPETLILENMALAPENQYVTEHYIVKSNLCAITNFRPDHQEIMGKSKEDIARTLFFSFPENSKIVIPGIEVNPSVETMAIKLNSNLSVAKVSHEKHNSVLPAFIPQFEILKEIKRIYNISDQAYAKTYENYEQLIQSQNFLVRVPQIKGEKYLVNLFSCNDVTSSNELIKNLEQSGIIQPPYDILLACRGDRPLRTIAFLEWILNSLKWQRLYLTGIFPRLSVNRMLRPYRKASREIILSDKIEPEKLFSQLDAGVTFILGLGNYVNTGEKFLSYLECA